MVCCLLCFSGEPVDGDERSQRHGKFQISMMDAVCKGQPCCCISCFCPCCAACNARKEVTYERLLMLFELFIWHFITLGSWWWYVQICLLPRLYPGMLLLQARQMRWIILSWLLFVFGSFLLRGSQYVYYSLVHDGQAQPRQRWMRQQTYPIE